MNKPLLFVALALAIVPLAQGLSGAAITNGGFDESGDGWTFTNTDTGVDFGGYGNVGTPSAGYAAVDGMGLCQGNAPGQGSPQMSQTVNGFVAGEGYVLSFDFERILSQYGQGGANTFAVYVGGALLFEGSTGTGWTHVDAPFTATASSVTITFVTERNCDDSSYGVDNVALAPDSTPPVPTPELPTIALLGAGLVAMVGLVALKRR